MAGAIVLLLAGTQILDWYWVVLLALVSLGTGLYRVRNRVPSVYQVAQRIDRRLNLADSLSTATYFSSPDAHGDPAIRERQYQEAENIARSIDVRAGVPYQRPRFAYAALGLTLVALGLFAVRYAVIGSLNLEPSLVKMAFDTFFPPQPELAKAAKQPKRINAPGEDNSSDAPDSQAEDKPEAEVQPVDSPDQENQQAADSKNANQDDQQADAKKDQPGEDADKGDKSNNASQADQQESKDGREKGDKEQNGKQDSKASSQNDSSSSLVDKLRDAMANMMNKMKPSQKQGDQSQKNAQQGPKNGKADKNPKQSNAKNQDQKSESQSDQQNDDSDQKQSAEANGAEKSNDKNASKDSKSGIGSADGDKTAKLAEQLSAMGKISEILGKRSQNVTGEVMVEVGQSKQQLRTPWAQRQATHVEAGSEIHRDEVPLMYQQFVEQYFEEIHKTAPPAPATKKN